MRKTLCHSHNLQIQFGCFDGENFHARKMVVSYNFFRLSSHTLEKKSCPS
jgi:hypothetical protein